MFIISVFLLTALASGAFADTPANCTYDSILGTWHMFEGPRGQTGKSIHCDGQTVGNLKHVTTVKLEYPNVCTDEFGNRGTWTLIYNQGFEVIVNSRKFFAFSNYTTVGQKTVSLCHQTLPGWSHDVLSRDWACYVGQKVNGESQRESTRVEPTGVYKPSPNFIEQINKAQKSWTATDYAQFHGMPYKKLIRMAGGEARAVRGPGAKESTPAEIAAAASLPERFDWRNVKGEDFVSPVRNQGGCGSCFAFASMAALEARTRILTNNTHKPVFSPQDVLDCSFYQQGCAGGFAYLTEGKYAQDFGVVEEACNPYRGTTKNPPVCDTKPSCRRNYATNYSYVGGYYGGCNEQLMLQELVNNGPLAVGFEVYNDFMQYSGGIYHHTGVKDEVNEIFKYNPFQLTNHAVLIVGYGIQETSNQKYWLVKNSWGESWGLQGYFLIRRGNDECGIESVAFGATPIPTY